MLQGRVGWQGIIPSRAAKMGSIAVDKGIAKLGTPGEFYDQLEPEKIAEHILASALATSTSWSSGILEREHPTAVAATRPAPCARPCTPACRPSCRRSSTRSPTSSAATSTSCWTSS